MDTRKLMVGDYVWANGNLAKVIEIHEKGLFLTNDNSTHFYMLSQHIVPVPLTAEILEKNGFAYTVLGSWHWGMEDNITLTEEPLVWWLHIDSLDVAGEISLAIANVHDLQHAIRLFGLKKEIVL